jgi:hypothetical protein
VMLMVAVRVRHAPLMPQLRDVTQSHQSFWRRDRRRAHAFCKRMDDGK